MSDDFSDPDGNWNVHVESYVSAVVLVVGFMWFVLSERRGVYGIGLLVAYVATFAGVRAWRLRRRAR